MFSDFLFSIIVACYNQAHYLQDSLKSVCAQTYTGWECILVNDGSTDQTEGIAEEWTKRDKRFKLFSKTNGGLSSARNYGIERAKGEYLLFLDADDVIYPDYLKVAYGAAQKNKSAIFISGYKFLNGDFSCLLSEVNPKVTNSTFLSQLSYSPIAPVHSYIISRSCIEKTGLFDESLRSAEDWDLWLRAGKLGASIKTLAYSGAGYRMLPASMSRNPEAFFSSILEVANRARTNDKRIAETQVISGEPIEPVLIKNLLINCGTYLFSGRLEEAKAMFQKTVANYNLKPTAEDFNNLFSYLTYTNSVDENAREAFWSAHVAQLSNFLFFCQNLMNVKNLYAAAFLNLLVGQLHPCNVASIVPHIRTKDLLKESAQSIASKIFRRLKSGHHFL